MLATREIGITTSFAVSTASKSIILERHQRRTVFSGRWDHAVSKASFRPAILLCGVAHTSLFRIDQIGKSMQLRHGLEGGNKFMYPNSALWGLKPFWAIFSTGDGKPSWMKT